ncbi:MAG: YidB family protein [Azonexus sp.]|nr:YidB family protein [Azonexus sp.]
MGLLDQVVGALAGGQSGSGNNQLIQTVFQLINNPQVGGLDGLLKTLQQGGLGEAVSSWISTGQNMPVSAEQIQSSLGGPMLDGFAEQAGMTQQQASGSLAELLPQLIDKLTPNGQLPQAGQGDLLAQGLDLLKKGGLFS